MESLIAFLFGAGIFLGLVLGFYWLIWSLWCWVLPQIWIGGPENIVSPGFWLFAGAFFLMSIVGKAVFGRSSKAKP